MTISPATRQTVIDLARNGIEPRWILEQVAGEIDILGIYDVLRRARREGVPIPPFRMGRPREGSAGQPLYLDRRSISVPGDVYEGLAPHARRRGVTVHRLVRTLLTTLVADDLVNATLDDEGAR